MKNKKIKTWKQRQAYVHKLCEKVESEKKRKLLENKAKPILIKKQVQ